MTVRNTPESIELPAPSCFGCGHLIRKPSDAQWDFFRAGIKVHDVPACLDLAEVRLAKSAAWIAR